MLRMNANKLMDIHDFYTIETPPSSSTSKDSTDDFLSRNQLKLSKTNIQQISSNTIICSTSKSSLIKNPINIKDHQVILLLTIFIKYKYILLSLLKQNICFIFVGLILK